MSLFLHVPRHAGAVPDANASVNLAHPMLRGASHIFSHDHRVNHVTGIEPTWNSSTRTIHPSAQGVNPNWNSGERYHTSPGGATDTTTPWTYAALVGIYNGSGGKAVVSHNDVAATAPFDRGIHWGSGTGWYGWIWRGASHTLLLGDPAIGSSYPYRVVPIVMTCDTSTLAMYINGRRKSTGTSGITGSALASTSVLSIGYGSMESTAHRMNGDLPLFIRIYGRAWSAEEAREFTRDPWQFFDWTPGELYFIQSAAATTNATLTATEAADTVAGTAIAIVAATLAATEAADAVAASATVEQVGEVSATLAATEAADALAATAAARVSVTVDGAEASDSLAAQVSALLSASLSRTEAADTLAAALTAAVHGALAKTEDADALASAATFTISLTLNKAEAADTLNASVQGDEPTTDAALVQTEAADTLAAALTARVGVTLSRQEAADTVVGSSVSLIAATGNLADVADALVGNAALTVTIQGSVAEAADLLASSATLAISAALDRTDTADTLVSNVVEVGLEDMPYHPDWRIASDQAAFLVASNQAAFRIAATGRDFTVRSASNAYRVG